MAGRVEQPGPRRARAITAFVIAAALAATACEATIVDETNATRARVAVGALATSPALTGAARAHTAASISGSPGCEKATEDRGDGVLGRIDRTIGDPANEPHRLVASGRLTVPVMHVWNHNDNNVCGAVPIPCPLPDGSTPTMGAADCSHEPFRLAIAAFGAPTHSVNMGVCVEGNDATTPCDRHVVTTQQNGVNSDPAAPADHQAAILDWVRQRLADD